MDVFVSMVNNLLTVYTYSISIISLTDFIASTSDTVVPAQKIAGSRGTSNMPIIQYDQIIDFYNFQTARVEFYSD